MLSLWSDTSKLPDFPPLEGDVRSDVLIIGGGLAGVLLAHTLAQRGVDYALLEAETICSGVTKNTTAKITSQHGLIYDKLIRELGMERARMYLDANEAALAKYRRLCADIDCGFETRDNYVYSIADAKKLDRELEALARLGFPAEYAAALPLPFDTAGAVKFPSQAQFHPLRFVSAIAKGLNIYEHSMVRELRPGSAATSRGRVSAKRIVVCTHFPFLNKHGGYFLKLYQSRSYVLALEGAPGVEGMYVDESDKGLSFREGEGLLLLGGGGHRTGKSGGGWRELEELAARYYPEATIKYRWATQDCMSLDGAPYIGRYSKRTPELYVAAGFNKWGMTSAMAAAMVLADMLTGRESPYAPAFSPSRSILRPQLAVNGAEAVINLLTPTARRCPHLGCALKWNEQEHSWDCPCHGSRFTEAVELIDNPATGGLKGEKA